MGRFLRGVAALAVFCCVVPAHAEVVARGAPAAGSVIARKTGEEVRFIDVSDLAQRRRQAGPAGRRHAAHQRRWAAWRCCSPTTRRCGSAATRRCWSSRSARPPTRRSALQSGTIWARAERGGEGLTVETPAAAAAIRGTDWTMTVDGGKTSLIVLEGLVELSNEFGSVSVAQGEAAVASIGQAPTKVVIVDPDDREQMLFYLSLRNSFGWMPASPLSSPDMRGQRARIGAMPEAARTAEDWLTLAEVSLSYDGRQAALDAADAGARASASPPRRKRGST